MHDLTRLNRRQSNGKGGVRVQRGWWVLFIVCGHNSRQHGPGVADAKALDLLKA
jgi:hypothetical protein